MSAGKAVRVPEALHAQLAARVATHGPITAQVERALLAALEPTPALPPETEVVVVELPAQPARAHAPSGGRASGITRVGRRLRTRAEYEADEPCRHPISRRIGDGCGACGQAVPKAKPRYRNG